VADILPQLTFEQQVPSAQIPSPLIPKPQPSMPGGEVGSEVGNGVGSGVVDVGLGVANVRVGVWFGPPEQ